MPNNFQTINIPKKNYRDIKVLKIALGYQTGKSFTVGEILDELILQLRISNPALYKSYNELLKKREE